MSFLHRPSTPPSRDTQFVNFSWELPLANCCIARGNAVRRRRQSGLGRIERLRARGRSQRNHLGWLESRASQKVSRGEKAGKWCGSTRAMMVAPMLVDICGLLRSIILLLDMVGCSMHGIVFMGFRRS